MSDKDRRRYFRIEDTVGIKTEAVPPHQLDERLNDFWTNQHEFSIQNEFNHQLDQHAADLLAIKKIYPAIARYLSVLQNQVDLLSSKILLEKDMPTDYRQAVNISAQGISFLSSESISAGEVIEINMQLLPDRQQIVIFAKVISCHKITDEQYQLTLDFEHIHEADREILIKHIHGKQLKALGAARFQEDH